MTITENIARVREQIYAAARRAHRNPEEIDLMAVTKGVAVDRIRESFQCGVRLFGENRVQEFQTKREALGGMDAAEWHMIGHLQTNKATRAVELFDAIDSVDSVRLAEKIDFAAEQLGKKIPILIEINVGGEPAKSGIALGSGELDNILSAAQGLRSIEICGLMAVPPYSDDPEQSRPYFRQMKQLFDNVSLQRSPGVRMKTLSIGMSHDFEIAVEEGSTCVRIGTAIFGERQSARSKD